MYIPIWHLKEKHGIQVFPILLPNPTPIFESLDSYGNGMGSRLWGPGGSRVFDFPIGEIPNLETPHFLTVQPLGINPKMSPENGWGYWICGCFLGNVRTWQEGMEGQGLGFLWFFYYPKDPEKPSKLAWFWGPGPKPCVMQVHSPFQWRVQWSLGQACLEQSSPIGFGRFFNLELALDGILWGPENGARHWCWRCGCGSLGDEQEDRQDMLDDFDTNSENSGWKQWFNSAKKY